MTAQTFTPFLDLRAIVIATLAAFVLFAAPASAAEGRVLYTSPDATSNWPNCDTPQKPCDLHWLAEQYAQKGDTIVLLPGSYGTPSHPLTALFVNSPITLTGQAGEPMPKLYFDAQVSGIYMCGGGSLARLEVHNTNETGAPFLIDSDGNCDDLYGQGVIERVVAVGARYGCRLDRGAPVLRNSVCRSTGKDGAAMSIKHGGNYEVRNVTAIASGEGSFGLHAETASHDPVTVDVVNTIMRGTQVDVYADAPGSTPLEVRIGYSNYRTTWINGPPGTLAEDPQGTNQWAAPKFVDATAGDYRQAVGSPTIDAGVVGAANGEFDLEGDKRTVGGSTDIGADEFPMEFRSGGSGSNPESGNGSEPSEGSGSETGPDGPTNPEVIDPHGWGPLTITGALKRRAWRATRGTKLLVRLSRNADVRVQLRRRQGSRFVRAGRLALGTLAAGEHSVRLRSPLPNGRKLRSGRYRLVLRAQTSDARVTSEPIRFRVLAPRG